MFDDFEYIDYYLYVMLKEMCTNCFKVLGVPSRMRLYMYLKGKQDKSSVSELVGISGLTQPTVSYHLKEMEHVGILTSNKVGKEVYYKVGGGCESCLLRNA